MRRPANIVWKTVDNSGSIILNLESGRYYSLNETAMAAWILLESGEPSENVAKGVAAAHGTDESIVLQDIEDFVERLLVIGLIEEGDPDGERRRLCATVAKSLPAGSIYVKPELIAHDAVEKVTAGTSGSGGSYSYTYYYYA